MTREEALSTFKKEMERLAAVAVIGKYCCDATYGADDTIEGWLKFMQPLYKIKVARNHGAGDALIEEMWPNILASVQKAQNYENGIR